MIALDTSAIVAIAMEEPECERFETLIAKNRTIIGTPTPLEARIVLGTTVHDPKNLEAVFPSPPSS